MVNPDYDSASFEAQLCQIESNLRDAHQILKSKEFVNHVLATENNFNNANGLDDKRYKLSLQMAALVQDFNQFADRIRDL